jgi:hypothetical protein
MYGKLMFNMWRMLPILVSNSKSLIRLWENEFLGTKHSHLRNNNSCLFFRFDFKAKFKLIVHNSQFLFSSQVVMWEGFVNFHVIFYRDLQFHTTII